MFAISRYRHKRIVSAGRNTLAPYAENPPDLTVGEDDILFLDLEWVDRDSSERREVLENGLFEKYAVRRCLAGKARPRAVCGTLPLHPAKIIDLGGDPLFSRQLPAPWSEPGLLTRVRTSSPSTGRAVLERRPAIAVRISPFPALGSTPTIR
jgi:hypothetical protein